MLSLRVNGTIHQLTVDPETPLLWVLREQLGLTGTKYSCGIAECGACTVHVDGEATLSCVTSVGEVAGTDIVTIEGFYGQVAESLRWAWIAEDVPQCGYCQPGQIMTAAKLLQENHTQQMRRLMKPCRWFFAGAAHIRPSGAPFIVPPGNYSYVSGDKIL